MILDTNAVSDWWLGTPALVKILERATAIYLPVPVLAEYQFGILKSKHRKKMELWFEKAKMTSTILSVDSDTADIYAELRLTLENAGKKIPMNDLWIAAIVCQHKLPIVSRDSHFDHITEIQRIAF